MTDRPEAIALAVGLIILAVAIPAMIHITAQCHAAGGTPVRGLIWLECIR
jgi:hypothetical protein